MFLIHLGHQVLQGGLLRLNPKNAYWIFVKFIEPTGKGVTRGK